jgi:S-adenosylmethionine synthetase
LAAILEAGARRLLSQINRPEGPAREDRAMEVSVAPLPAPTAAQGAFETVERKGLGHPDSICDALAENLSIGLARFYLERFGAVLHHNVDKGLLCGGAARPAFGGGEVLEPIEIYLAGRATREFRGVAVPLEELAVELSRAWLAANLRHLDPVRHVRIVPRIRPTSPDLAALFLRQQAGGAPLANDTSIGAGFAPLDRLERAVLAAAQALNARETRDTHPEAGEDIKVMGVRRGEEIRLTVACALVGRHVESAADYREKKRRIGRLALGAARASDSVPVTVDVNTADGATEESYYLTVTGLSAESGDDGQVGRGNRVNGLITPYRPMSLEAAAGKNPVTHVGKLYNLAAQRIARAATVEIPAIEEASCLLVSQIGRPITEPQIAEVKLRPAGGGISASQVAGLEDIVRRELALLPTLWNEIVFGAVPVW